MKHTVLTAAALLAPAFVTDAALAQAVQWRAEDGGNGHWYQVVVEASGLAWPDARQRAEGRGGALASLGQASEAAFVRGLLSNGVCGGSSLQAGPYVGGFQDVGASDYSEPAGGWRWLDGSPFPGDASVTLDNNQGDQRYLHFISLFGGCNGPFQLDDVGLVTQNRAYIIEWSTDCNNDGTVDYGQIRAGLLPDENGNNIPDTCECAQHPELGACCVGDIVRDSRIDGADLAAVLSHWGPVTSNAVSTACDLDRSGTVDGTDLGILLAHWGPCAP